MKQVFVRTAIAAAFVPMFATADEIRALDAHEHGSGTLGIAVSGAQVALSFEAPGADIVGFEHPAASAADRAAVAAAISDLAHPLELFVLPADAGCAVTEAKVEVIGGDAHDDEHDHEAHDDHDGHDDHDDHDDHAEDHGDHEDHGAVHSEFVAEYVLSCSTQQAITQIEFGYFDRFANARELDVQVVTDQGAQAFEVERDAPVLRLKGMF